MKLKLLKSLTLALALTLVGTAVVPVNAANTNGNVIDEEMLDDNGMDIGMDMDEEMLDDDGMDMDEEYGNLELDTDLADIDNEFEDSEGGTGRI